MKKEQGFRSVLDELSPDLRGQLTLHCYGPALATVPFFQPSLVGLTRSEQAAVSTEGRSFAQQVAVRLRSVVIGPHEYAFFAGEQATTM